MSDANLVTQSALLTLGEKLDQVQASLEAHVDSTHGQTHLGLQVTTPAVLYKDSAGQTWGDRVGVVLVNGTKYYFPAKIV